MAPYDFHRGKWDVEAGRTFKHNEDQARSWGHRKEHSVFRDWGVALIDWCLEFCRIRSWRACSLKSG